MGEAECINGFVAEIALFLAYLGLVARLWKREGCVVGRVVEVEVFVAIVGFVFFVLGRFIGGGEFAEAAGGGFRGSWLGFSISFELQIDGSLRHVASN